MWTEGYHGVVIFLNESLRFRKWNACTTSKNCIMQNFFLLKPKMHSYKPLISSFLKAKEKYRGMFETQSPETRQVQERLVSTLEHLQVQKWDRTKCPDEQASSVGMPNPLKMFYRNFSQLGKRSNSVIRFRSVIGSKIGVMSDQRRV